MRKVSFGITLIALLTGLVQTTGVAQASQESASLQGAAVAPFGAPITRLAVEFTPAARAQADGDERFNAEALRNALLAELKNRKLLDLQPSGTGRAAVMQIEEFSVQATSNVVVLGRLASSGVLAGTFRVRDSAGGATREWPVRTELAMKVSRSGTEKNPLKALYAAFARQMADALTGAAQGAPPHR